MMTSHVGNSSQRIYFTLILSILIIHGNSFQQFLPYGAKQSYTLYPIRSDTSLQTGNSDHFNDMTVKDLKDLLREKGLTVTGLKKELIERLSASPSTGSSTGSSSETDYLITPISKPVKKTSTSALLRKTKILLDDNISILVDATNDDVRVTQESKESKGSVKKQIKEQVITSSTTREMTQNSQMKLKVEVENNKKNVNLSPKKRVPYDIDDDDFLNDIMDDGDDNNNNNGYNSYNNDNNRDSGRNSGSDRNSDRQETSRSQPQRSAASATQSNSNSNSNSVRSVSRSIIDSIEEDGENEGEEDEQQEQEQNDKNNGGKTAWPGPGVPWQSGPPVGINGRSDPRGKKDQNIKIDSLHCL